MAGKVNKQDIPNSKNFCMMPWVHMHLWPNSSAHYCCVSDSSKPIGMYDGDLGKLANADTIKQVRKNMLHDLPSEACKRCYELEKNGVYSLRKNSNSKFSKYFEEVERTAADGSIEKLTMRYLDIRFSNRCNLKCRSCGPELSSSWVPDQKKLFPGDWDNKPTIIEIDKQKLWADLMPHLLHIEEAYFAGGEPLITEEIYSILDYWLENNYTTPQIGFTTNFNNLNFKSKNIIEYWKRFPKITVSASLDASGSRAEYMRKGTNWDKIVENRKLMLAECPEVKFEITPTISIFNVWHFPDFHMDWLQQGLLTHNDLRLNLLTNPMNMSIKIIPVAKRKPIIEKWINTKEEILRLFGIKPSMFSQTAEGYDAIIRSLKEDEYVNLQSEFFKRNRLVDKLRQENFYKVFPEMKDILKPSLINFIQDSFS